MRTHTHTCPRRSLWLSGSAASVLGGGGWQTSEQRADRLSPLFTLHRASARTAGYLAPTSSATVVIPIRLLCQAHPSTQTFIYTRISIYIRAHRRATCAQRGNWKGEGRGVSSCIIVGIPQAREGEQIRDNEWPALESEIPPDAIRIIREMPEFELRVCVCSCARVCVWECERATAWLFKPRASGWVCGCRDTQSATSCDCSDEGDARARAEQSIIEWKAPINDPKVEALIELTIRSRKRENVPTDKPLTLCWQKYIDQNGNPQNT